ncbi:MAG: DtxR family transcriptional regulator [Bacteroidetes bacterium]|nr:DtxR family transcriptional regulator [Bacteroidota bacterium]
MITLVAGTLVLIILSYVFWPKKGLLAIFKGSSINSKREKIEDALKHLYDCEYNSNRCSMDSLAGNLSVSRESAADIISEMQKMSLIELSDDKLKLSDEGRSYALRIIRTHRLWEKYLAEETSVNESEWHTSAEEMEHILSNQEADQLAADIGNPLFDPHGDPIPSSNGKMPERKGILLTELSEGQFANVLHIEDEPPALYAQIIAEGIYAGQQIRLIEKNNERIKFEANGEVKVLAPIIAANISVKHISDNEKLIKSFNRLSDLKVGQSGTIIGISKAIRGTQRRRLLDLGMVPGTNVSAEIQSLGGDPTGYRIRGATIAIRKNHANHVFIKEIESRQ